MEETEDWLTILVCEPRNYDRILELSKTTQEPYTLEDLERISATARSRNTVAMISFMDMKKAWGM